MKTTMIKMLSSIFCLVIYLCLIPSASAEGDVVATGTCGDNATWMLDEEGKLIISGTGIMYDYPFDETGPWGVTVTNIVIEDGITSIGNFAFNGCKDLINVSIPYSIKRIGDGTFQECENLTSIKLPSSVTSVGNWAFGRCPIHSVFIDDLESWLNITSPDSPESNYNFMFASYGGYISYSKDLYINGIVVRDIIIPDGVEKIPGWAFRDFTGIRNIQIPSSVAYIGQYAFGGCTGLTSITIPSGVTTIDAYAFCGCNRITSISIPRTVTSIGSAAFSECKISSLYIDDLASWLNISFGWGNANPLELASQDVLLYVNGELLEDLIIPEGITTIPKRAFSNCRNIRRVILPYGVSKIEESAFSNCKSLVDVTLPYGLQSIGRFAFESCGLNKLVIPNSVTSIGAYAFRYCNNLLSVVLSSNMWNVEQSVFYQCEKLKEVYLPLSITDIYSEAFRRCPVEIVYYAGTEDDRETMLIDTGNQNLTEAEWCYSSSIPVDTLNVLYLPNSLKTIEREAFSGVNAQAIIIPTSVETIDPYAFSYCNNLEVLYFEGSPLTISSAALSGCNSVVISVIKGSSAETWAEELEYPIAYH